MTEKKRKNHPVPLVGITGGIGSGKSSFAGVFQKAGAYIIDADKIGKEVLENNSNVFSEIVKQFGREVLENENKIDRKRLASVVFGNRGKLKKLNSIIHPPMIRLIEERVKNEFELKRTPMVVIDAALIFEAKVENKFDYIVNICANVENRIRRTVLKNRMPEEEIKQRINAQIPEDIKRRRADFNVENNGGLEDLRRMGEVIFNEILGDFKKSVK